MKDVIGMDVISISSLTGKTIMITGATGLIGSNIVRTLIAQGEKYGVPIHIIALIRNNSKAREVFDKYYEKIECIVADVTENISIPGQIDYIIHAASQTSSKDFINRPVETIHTAFAGTYNMLELAREKNVKKVVYLSTMEVYGCPSSDAEIFENHGTDLNTMSVRSCYPESKRLCENLCISYMEEYNIPINVVRLTQTFGPGVQYNDERVFAEFSRCVIEKRNIVLHTKGETKRSYLHTQDAVNAILIVLLKGDNGQAYNAANESTYCSIFEMANFVKERLANNKINVIIEVEDEKKFGYAPTLKMNLNTSKLRLLGWKPERDLEYMFSSMIEDMQVKKFETKR